MSAHLLGYFSPGSPDWHEARRTRLGGSEIAAVVGLSPWQSRFSLWHAKKGAVSEQVENASMEWGKRLEPVICEKFCEERFGMLVGRPAGTWVHDERDWQLANPDLFMLPSLDGLEALTDRPETLLEVKTARYGDEWGPSQSMDADAIPIYYRCQVQWYLDVLGLPHGYVSVLIAGSDYREYLVQADAEEQAFLRAEGEAFMASLAADERPNLDGHAATYEAVKELHPDIDGSDVELSPALADRYCRALANFKAAESAKTLATSAVADAMGEAQRAKCAGRLIARRQAKGDGTPYVVAAPKLPPALVEVSA